MSSIVRLRILSRPIAAPWTGGELLGELGRRTQDIRLSQLAEAWDREQARIVRERFEQMLESRRVQ